MQLQPTCVYERHPVVACAEVLNAGVVNMQLRPAAPYKLSHPECIP